MIEKYVNAEELKQLLSSLVVVVGGLTIAGLLASILVPGLRNANKPEAPMPVTPVVGELGWLDPTEFPPEQGRVIPPLDPKALIAPSPDLIARGKQVFTQNCTSCHGEQGRGDGPASTTMDPRPRNFTSSAGWDKGYDLPTIFKTVTEGIQGTSMASFDYLSKRDRMALAHYVQSFGSFPHGTGSPQAMEDLSKKLAAAGGKTPNKIPVSMAMAKLEEEFSAPPLLTVASEDHSPAAELFRRVIVDRTRAAQTLAGSESWRAGAKELAASILPGVPENGFSESVATLSAEEWKELHGELIKLVGR
jgi:mono/diheme cytochrome c family protein